MRTLTFHALVDAEIKMAVAYYANHSETLGTRFIADFDRTIKEILEQPLAWPQRNAVCRCHKLRHFPYGVIYFVSPESIRILAFMHLHRHPDFWRGRE